MYAVKACGAVEQWIEPPEPALYRYMLNSRHRAANDNRRLYAGSFRTALIGILSLITALIH